MIEVQVTKEKVQDLRRYGEEYSLRVRMTQSIETRHFIDQCMLLATRSPPPQKYIIDKMVDDIARSFRDKLRAKVFQAMSNPAKQVWSN